MRTLSRFASTAALALATILVFSCSSDDGGDNTPSGISGKYQIYYPDMSLYKGNGTISYKNRLTLGEVNNGIFSFNLPANPEIGRWEKLSEYYAYSNDDGEDAIVDININPSDAEIYNMDKELGFSYDIALYSNGEHVSSIIPIAFDGDYVTRVGFEYYSKDVSIKGSYEDEYGKEEFDIKGKKGWNKIYHKYKTYNCRFKTLDKCLEAVNEFAQANSNIIEQLGNITTYKQCLEALKLLYGEEDVCADFTITTDNIAEERWTLGYFSWYEQDWIDEYDDSEGDDYGNGGNENMFSYCVYPDAQICMEGSFSSCANGGIPLDYCPFSDEPWDWNDWDECEEPTGYCYNSEGDEWCDPMPSWITESECTATPGASIATLEWCKANAEDYWNPCDDYDFAFKGSALMKKNAVSAKKGAMLAKKGAVSTVSMKKASVPVKKKAKALRGKKSKHSALPLR